MLIKYLIFFFLPGNRLWIGTGSWRVPLVSWLKSGDGPSQATPTSLSPNRGPEETPEQTEARVSPLSVHFGTSAVFVRVENGYLRNMAEFFPPFIAGSDRCWTSVMKARRVRSLLASLLFAVGLWEFAYPAHPPVFALWTWPGPPTTSLE